MADRLPKEVRSRIMSSVKTKDTAPEILVRSVLHKLGYRFRIHKKDLPGTPDICLPKYKKVIFVNGCFWHQHTECNKSITPKTNYEFWDRKLKKNVQRDRRNINELKNLGWEVLIVWECELRDVDTLASRLKSFLSD